MIHSSASLISHITSSLTRRSKALFLGVQTLTQFLHIIVLSLSDKIRAHCWLSFSVRIPAARCLRNFSWSSRALAKRRLVFRYITHHTRLRSCSQIRKYLEPPIVSRRLSHKRLQLQHASCPSRLGKNFLIIQKIELERTLDCRHSTFCSNVGKTWMPQISRIGSS